MTNPGSSRAGDQIESLREHAKTNKNAATAIVRYEALLRHGWDARIIYLGDRWLVEEFYSSADALSCFAVSFPKDENA